MFKFLLLLYILGAILNTAIVFAEVYIFTKKFIKQYPNYKRKTKTPTNVKAIFQALFLIFCPVLHWIVAFILIDKWEELEVAIIADLKSKYVEETA